MEIKNDEVRNFFKNMTRTTNCILSCIISGGFSYFYATRVLFNKEYRGHFNSPQRMYNRSMTIFHMKEVYARFCLGFMITYATFSFARQYLGGDQDEIKFDESEQIIKMDQKDIKEKNKFYLKIE